MHTYIAQMLSSFVVTFDYHHMAIVVKSIMSNITAMGSTEGRHLERDAVTDTKWVAVAGADNAKPAGLLTRYGLFDKKFVQLLTSRPSTPTSTVNPPHVPRLQASTRSSPFKSITEPHVNLQSTTASLFTRTQSVDSIPACRTSSPSKPARVDDFAHHENSQNTTRGLLLESQSAAAPSDSQ